MRKICRAFKMTDPDEALAHIGQNWEPVASYGDYAYGHWLHTWDDGSRILGRCRACGGCILLQCSEFHSMMDDDSYYRDYFPVDGADEADALNRAHDGFSLEQHFPGRWLMVTNGRAAWSRPQEADSTEDSPAGT